MRSSYSANTCYLCNDNPNSKAFIDYRQFGEQMISWVNNEVSWNNIVVQAGDYNEYQCEGCKYIVWNAVVCLGNLLIKLNIKIYDIGYLNE